MTIGKYIVKYAGAPVKFYPLRPDCVWFEVVPLSQATIFTGQSHAWGAIQDYKLPSVRANVVPLERELQLEAAESLTRN